jgi:hypothetical protein
MEQTTSTSANHTHTQQKLLNTRPIKTTTNNVSEFWVLINKKNNIFFNNYEITKYPYGE